MRPLLQFLLWGRGCNATVSCEVEFLKTFFSPWSEPKPSPYCCLRTGSAAFAIYRTCTIRIWLTFKWLFRFDFQLCSVSATEMEIVKAEWIHVLNPIVDMKLRSRGNRRPLTSFTPANLLLGNMLLLAVFRFKLPSFQFVLTNALKKHASVKCQIDNTVKSQPWYNLKQVGFHCKRLRVLSAWRQITFCKLKSVFFLFFF